jgi:hypothetical protein
MREIHTRLRNWPRAFGEPVRVHPHAQFEERVGSIFPVVVRFAVHQSAFEVVVLDIILMAAS